MGRDLPAVCGSVCSLFAAQAAAHPASVALVHGQATLTYAQLERKASRIARSLVARGLAGSLIGICADRSLELVVSVLAVMMADAAYVPLDPSYPGDRLAHMIADADVSLVITHGRGSEAVSLGGRPTVRFADLLAASETEVALPAIGPRDRAYVIYTSGSTGKPKGVVLEHRGLANLALAQSEAFQVSAGTRVLQFAAFSFDASVSEIFSTLVVGGTLVTVDRNELLPGALERVLREHAIAVVTLPPSLLAILSPDDLPALETVVSAGEACTAEIVRRWAGTHRFINAYGPTETTVCATLGTCRDTGEDPSIGLPLRGATVHLLDANSQPVPDGVAGELYVGGIGVARGYHGRPELTAERFVPDPFGEPGARLYRTGDLGRRLPSGEIMYLGRGDEQIKLRGYRIEPGEIEAALARRAGVTAAVTARDNGRGETVLVAYVVPSTARHEDLRAALSAELPEYMIPHLFVPLDDFPRTPSGKIDRRALPAPSLRVSKNRTSSLSGIFEKKLGALWCELLGIEDVDANDDFFWLGGDSLLAARMLLRAGAIFGVDLSFGLLFSTQATIATMAARIASEVIERSPEHAFEEAYARVVAMSHGEAQKFLAAEAGV